MSTTKGPWKWTDDRQGNRWGRKELAPCVITGTVEGLIDISNEDAALIEAVPEIIEALKDMITSYRRYGSPLPLEQEVVNAISALEKAGVEL